LHGLSPWNVESASVAPRDAWHTGLAKPKKRRIGADDVTKLFRQFDSVTPRRDGELIRRDIPGLRRDLAWRSRPAPPLGTHEYAPTIQSQPPQT